MPVWFLVLDRIYRIIWPGYAGLGFAPNLVVNKGAAWYIQHLTLNWGRKVKLGLRRKAQKQVWGIGC